MKRRRKQHRGGVPNHIEHTWNLGANSIHRSRKISQRDIEGNGLKLQESVRSWVCQIYTGSK